ncbi:hypothetical protein GLOTRDRAFT_134364 [Gloeophyllum trabeum ATCC 11539]|uniref:Fungal-type protein kinase domain-containing protein n=1 Tax=Gloeophyllum trabeum (strain ATCC 11539 / FP-39264 / Madison 617) TaxID=670483 RepID=S7PRJ7_GLOTA|nr:uncharacterized protein GLOTRDRAFT_134364 [Gloeophyllum trabeum ATCC 11539]EPQ49993.1 hypothetical protein GLOTRDRAFT_134364 [Gloeophyllum trabeum ATCC 11539]
MPSSKSPSSNWDEVKWVDSKLEAGLSNPRYESSLYGVINTLLGHCFPGKDYFIVKPQARLRLRASADHESDNSDDARSQDSYGDEVESRAVKGPEPDIVIPDWVVSRVVNALHEEPLAIVEAKVTDDEGLWQRTKAQFQLQMGRLASKTQRRPIFGAIVSGTTAYCYIMTGSMTRHNTERLSSSGLHGAALASDEWRRWLDRVHNEGLTIATEWE